MKKTKPTLVFLTVLCFFNLTKAQQPQSEFSIQDETRDHYAANVPNHEHFITSETLLDFDTEDLNMNQPAEFNGDAYHESYEDNSSSDNLERSTFDSSVTFTYDGSWDAEGDPFSVGVSSSDVIVIQSGSIDILADITLSLITVETGASMTIATGVTVTANVVLNSGAGEFASLISDGSIVGTVTYNRSTAQAGVNELVSPPLTGQIFSVFALANSLNLAASGDLRAYATFLTATDTYYNLDVQVAVDGNHVLEAGAGYRGATTDGANLIYTGDVETGTVNLTLNDSGFAWNLIGNPYPSYLDFESFFTDNKLELDSENAAVYTYSGDSNNPWIVWNQATADNKDIVELIAPGQAFFVKSKVGGGSVDFTTNMRSHGNDSENLSRDAVSSHYGYTKLKLSSTTAEYNTEFYFNSNASEGLDPGYDASVFGSTPPAFSIYSSLIEGDASIALAIQALNNISMDDVVVPLGVYAGQGQELTFSVAESDMSDTTNVYLEDTVNNTVTLLNTGDHNFTPSTDLSGTGRFYLRFETTTLSDVDVDFDSLKIYVNNLAKTINIDGQLYNETNAKLYDVNGRLILSQNLDTYNANQSIDISSLTSGVYIVELDNNTTQRRIEKLMIK
ncbi:T9SS type A sorting domain-containing protein [Winogradskyella sediminis]|uniref:T9SS type A sorting domain-containing protein n=1 Tax=Winogradskyella sediminis TaxID=1382466 RepID=UPI003AA8304D